MAFDLVQYLAEQIDQQKPQLFKNSLKEQRSEQIRELNALCFGKLISLSRQNEDVFYQELLKQDPLYVQEIARHLVTSKQNESVLARQEQETAVTEILTLQMQELLQLNQTGNFTIRKFVNLLHAQIQYLSGLADDWVWTTNELSDLIGSKQPAQEALSLDENDQEANHMSHDTHIDTHVAESPVENVVPTWAKILEPAVALAVLAGLYCAYTQIIAVAL